MANYDEHRFSLLTIQNVHQHREFMRRINGARIISRVGFIYFRYKQRWVSTLFHYLGFDAAKYFDDTAYNHRTYSIASLPTGHGTKPENEREKKKKCIDKWMRTQQFRDVKETVSLKLLWNLVMFIFVFKSLWSHSILCKLKHYNAIWKNQVKTILCFSQLQFLHRRCWVFGGK